MTIPSAGFYVYVVNQGDQTVSCINEVNGSVLSTFSNDNFNYPLGVAITPNGRYAFVANHNSEVSATVTIIDVVNNVVLNRLGGFINPSYIAISPNGQYVYVADQANNGCIQVIDITDINKPVLKKPISLTVKKTQYEYSVGIAITSDGTTLYVATTVNVAVLAVDLSASPPSVSIVSENFGNPTIKSIAISETSNGTYLYLASQSSNEVLAMDASTGKVTSIANTSTSKYFSQPNAIAMTPDGTLAYVTNSKNSTVVVIDTESNTVSTTIPCGSTTTGIAIRSDQNYAYVGTSENTVITIEISTNAVVGNSINVGKGPASIAITPYPVLFSTYPVIANDASSNQLFVFNELTNSATPVSFGSYNGPVVLIPPISNAPGSHVYAYVGMQTNDGWFAVVDLTANADAYNQGVPHPISTMAMTADGNTIYSPTNDLNLLTINVTNNGPTASVTTSSQSITGISSGASFISCALDPTETYLYTFNESAATEIFCINIETGDATPITVPSNYPAPQNLISVVGSSSGYIYVLDKWLGIYGIETSSNTIIYYYNPTTTPNTNWANDCYNSIVISPDGTTAYLSMNQGCSTLSFFLMIVDLSNINAAPIGLPYDIMAPLAISPDGMYLFGINFTAVYKQYPQSILSVVATATSYSPGFIFSEIPYANPITALACGAVIPSVSKGKKRRRK
jgi:YVTN family beta-propeller protein